MPRKWKRLPNTCRLYRVIMGVVAFLAGLSIGTSDLWALAPMATSPESKPEDKHLSLQSTTKPTSIKLNTKLNKTSGKLVDDRENPGVQSWGIVGVITDYSSGRESSVAVLKNYATQKTYTLNVGQRLPASNLTLVTAERKNVQVSDGRKTHTLSMVPADTEQFASDSVASPVVENWPPNGEVILGDEQLAEQFSEQFRDLAGDYSGEGSGLANGLTESQRSFLKMYQESLHRIAEERFNAKSDRANTINGEQRSYRPTAELNHQPFTASEDETGYHHQSGEPYANAPYPDDAAQAHHGGMTFDEWMDAAGDYTFDASPVYSSGEHASGVVRQSGH